MRRGGTFNVKSVPHIQERYRIVEHGAFSRILKPKPRSFESRFLGHNSIKIILFINVVYFWNRLFNAFLLTYQAFLIFCLLGREKSLI